MNSTIPYVFLGCLVLVLVLTTPLYSFTASWRVTFPKSNNMGQLWRMN
jgi:hypothetical protein